MVSQLRNRAATFRFRPITTSICQTSEYALYMIQIYSLLLPLPFSLTIRTLPPNHPVCFQTGYADFSAEMCGISVMLLQFFWNRISLQICATIWAVFFMIIHVSSRPSLIGFGSVCLLKWHFFLIENAVPVKTPITSD